MPPASSVASANALDPGRPATALRPLWAALVAGGLVLTVTGTFLPWVLSGGIERNSYAIVGIVHRLGLLGDGSGAYALSWWPLLGPVAILPILLGILRCWRTAALIALVFGLLAGVIGGGVLAMAAGHGAVGVTLDSTGPVVTVVGAIVTVVGACALLRSERRRRSRRPVDVEARSAGLRAPHVHVSMERFPGSSRPNEYPLRAGTTSTENQ